MSRIEKIKEMLQQTGRDCFLEHALALEYIKIDKHQDALQIFTALLQYDPDYLGSYYHLGKLYEQLGDTSSALDIYSKGMQLANKLNDKHSFNELRSVKDELEC